MGKDIRKVFGDVKYGFYEFDVIGLRSLSGFMVSRTKKGVT